MKAIAAFMLSLGLGAAGGEIIEIEVPRVSYFSGWTFSEIEGNDADGAWRSRLKFPVNNVAVGGGLGILFGEEGELRLRGWATCDDAAGTMRDDDWLDGDRDIWSRSDAELDALVAKVQDPPRRGSRKQPPSVEPASAATRRRRVTSGILIRESGRD